MKFEIEKRLINFAVQIIKLAENRMKMKFASKHLSEQIIRSASSAALNYGEAQHAESKKDFIHKLNLVNKELKESHLNLEMMREADLMKDPTELDLLIIECQSLIRIFTKSIQTAKERLYGNDKAKG